MKGGVTVTISKLLRAALPLFLLAGCGQAAPVESVPLPETPPAETASAELEQALPETADRYVQEDEITVGTDTYTIRRMGADSESFDIWPVLDTVEAYRNGDFSVPVQVFTDFTFDTNAPVDGEFVVEDLNFDGWPDFRIFAFQARIGSGWFCWCWDPETEGFVLRQEMENIISPVADQAEQTIYSSRSYGLGGFQFSTYQWEDGALMETQCFAVMWDGDRLVDRWYVRRDGELCLEKEWYVEDRGDTMVVPEAEPYWALAQPKG